MYLCTRIMGVQNTGALWVGWGRASLPLLPVRRISSLKGNQSLAARLQSQIQQTQAIGRRDASHDKLLELACALDSSRCSAKERWASTRQRLASREQKGFRNGITRYSAVGNFENNSCLHADVPDASEVVHCPGSLRSKSCADFQCRVHRST